jgi:tetratricopeptide (TPR) repeat protein
VVHFSPVARGLFQPFLVAGIILTGVLAWQEVKIGRFYHQLKSTDALETFANFEELYRNPYSKYNVLHVSLPRYVTFALRQENRDGARKILPWAEDLTRLRGTYADWYNRALLHLKAGDEEQARVAIKVAIDRQPSFEPAWQFSHYLNVLEASRQTGRPVESFFPSEAFDGKSSMLEYFNGGN